MGAQYSQVRAIKYILWKVLGSVLQSSRMEEEWFKNLQPLLSFLSKTKAHKHKRSRRRFSQALISIL